MGWARDNIPGDCERIARELIPGWQPPGRRVCHCPYPGHADKNPSFQYDLERDSYRCFSHPDESEASGDLVDLWGRLNGLHDPKEALRRFIAHFAPELAAKASAGGKNKPRGAKAGSQAAPKSVPQVELDALPPLPETWLQSLETTRGWSRAMVQALDLRLWTPPAWLDDQAPRVAIPVRDEAGQLVNLRLYRPGGAARNKVLSFWTGARGTKVSYGEPPRLWPPAPPTEVAPGPVWLVEGEPDCLCALSQGLNAITATGGAGTWREEWTERFRQKEVVIAYDADQVGQRGAAKVAQTLAGVAASVRVLEWPGFMLSDGELPGNHGQDLTDWFMTHGRTRSELEALAQAAPLVDNPAAAQGLADQMQRYKAWSSFDEKKAYRGMLLVREILAEHRIVIEAQTKLIYRWDGKRWAQAVAEEIKKIITAKMGLTATRARIEEAWELIRSQVTMPRGEEMDLRPDLLCVANGMLDLNSGRLLPHDPAHRCTHYFPYEWRPQDPPDCRLFKRTLLEIMADPAVIEEVLEFIGYCLWHGQQYKKALLMVGRKDCGKSLLQEVIRQLLGPENCSAVNMADLEDQFQRVALHRKMANICGETSANFFASENFKRLTGGDPIQAAYKGVDTFSFNTQAKLIFAANEFPRVRDQSDAFYERMLAVHFPRQFKLGEAWADPHRLARIVPGELPGIFHLAVARLYRLRRRGAFAQCPSSQAFLNQYRMENDHISRFLQERCVFQHGDGTTPEGAKAAVYASYKKWCEDNGIKRPKDSARFWLAIKQSHPQVEMKNHGPICPDGTRPPWVIGMHLGEIEVSEA